MHMLKPGLVKADGYKGPGKLLLTETSLFAFGSNAGATRVGGQFGGLLGALIGHLIDSRRARHKSPAHLDDPEIRGLDSSVQKSLRGASLLAQMRLASLSAKCTKMGFEFEADGQPSVSYSGRFHKKTILGFLHERHVATRDG
jgi:hypothetical protein